jgi:hypothetical protein
VKLFSAVGKECFGMRRFASCCTSVGLRSTRALLMQFIGTQLADSSGAAVNETCNCVNKGATKI